MDLNKLYKEIEEAEVDLNTKRLKYIREALAENNGIIKLKFKEFKEFKETNDAFDFDDQFPVVIEIVGYDLITTFWEDFSIADKYGVPGVKDTYKRAFSEWKDYYKFFTGLTLVLNHKIWQHYESNRELAALYDRLWREADEYAIDNFKGEELDYYYRVTD